MHKKILSIMIIIVLTLGLVGCITSGDSEFPTTFTRTSDGLQVSLGMHRDEIDDILTPAEWQDLADPFIRVSRFYEEGVRISYSDDDIVWSMLISEVADQAEDWVIAGFSVGDSVQSVIDSEKFINFIHRPLGVIEIVDDAENPAYKLFIISDANQIITHIAITCEIGYSKYGAARM